MKAANGKMPVSADHQKWIHALMNVSPAAMHYCDPQGKLLAVNKRWCELTGRSAAEALGIGWREMIHLQDRAGLVAAWEKYVREVNGGLRKDGFRFEYRLMHKDGSSVRLCARCIDERDEDGKLLGFCGASLEVAEPFNSGASFVVSKEVLNNEWVSLISKVAPVGMYAVDLDGKCTWVSEKWSEISGWPAEAALGDGWKRIVHAVDLKRTMKEWEKTAAGTAPFVSQYRYVKPDGTEVWVLSRASEQRDAEGILSVYLGVVVDITELCEKNGSSNGGIKTPHIARLSKRENEVVGLLCEGLSNKVAAQRLGLSVRTVEAHRARIMHKLGIRSAVELVHRSLKEKTRAK